MLLRTLNNLEAKGLVLVFTETKRNADYLEYQLTDQGYPASSIHGDKTQREREDALRKFKTAITPILVATDVAARGLDINNVTQVRASVRDCVRAMSSGLGFGCGLWRWDLGAGWVWVGLGSILVRCYGSAGFGLVWFGLFVFFCFGFGGIWRCVVFGLICARCV